MDFLISTLLVVVAFAFAPVILSIPFGIAVSLGGIPGVILGIDPNGVRSRGRFIAASMLAGLGESYVYLGYVAVLVSNAYGCSEHAFRLVMWPVVFFAAVLPAFTFQGLARINRGKYGAVLEDSVCLIPPIAFLGFFVIAFFPNVIDWCWPWARVVASYTGICSWANFSK